MAQAQRYKLTLSKLDFISLVDDPAQPNATTLLIKRKGARLEGSTHAKFVKSSDSLGLAFFWAFTSTNADGTPHYDHHGDAIDQDFVKAAMDFMTDANGAVDEMHDYEATDARVVFAMPMTPEIAKAFSVETKQSGLMVAIKVTDEQLAKLKDGTYTGVSIAGLGTREAVEARKSGLDSEVIKGSLYTNEVDGHQHKIEVYDDGSMWCCGATSAGMENSHNHGVVFEDSKLTILADSGHTHELAEGQPGIIVVPEDTMVVVSSRRSPTTNQSAAQMRAGDSPRFVVAPTVKSQPEGTMTTPNNDAAKIIDLEKQVVTLQKRTDRAERIAKMSAPQLAHFNSIAADAQDEFLAKSSADRDVLLADISKADPVEFDLDGVAYRKSTQGYALAKRLLSEVEKNEAQEIEKQATAHLGNLAGDKALHGDIVKAIVSYTKTDLEKRGKMLAILDGANAIAKGRSTAPGGDGASGDMNVSTDAYETLTTELTKFCTAQKIDKVWTVGIAKFQATPEGRRLVEAHNAEHAARNAG